MSCLEPGPTAPLITATPWRVAMSFTRANGDEMTPASTATNETKRNTPTNNMRCMPETAGVRGLLDLTVQVRVRSYYNTALRPAISLNHCALSFGVRDSGNEAQSD